MVIFDIFRCCFWSLKGHTKCQFLENIQYSNAIKVLIFISNIKSYVPIKLCKTMGSIHLFK